MKRKIFTIFCAIFALAVTAAPVSAERALFERTVKNVDCGGITLTYLNTSMLTGKLMELPELVKKILIVADGSKADIRIAPELTGILVQALNPGAYQAFAASTVQKSENLYINKCFLTMNNTPALFNAFVRGNSPLDWHKLPANTRLAFKFPVNGSMLFDRLYQGFANAKSPELRKIVTLIDDLKKQGIDIKAISSSLNGDVLAVLTGSDIKDLAFRVEIPDTNGVISAFLQLAFVKRQGENFSRLPMPENATLQARIYYAQGKVIAVSHPKALTVTNTLASLPVFRNFAPFLPKAGYAYSLINLDAETIDNIAKSANIKFLPRMIKPFTVIDISVKAPDGLASIGASTADTAAISAAAPLACGAAILLPALNSARERARRASCINNLKQIGTGILMYAQDHREKYPATLAELYREKYIVDKPVFHCPSDDSSNDSYIYVGMVMNNGGSDASTTPILFDKPGIHSDNYVNVAFADGHVQGIILPNYTDPEQVIAYLNKMYKFPPQLLDALLKAVRSNQQ